MENWKQLELYDFRCFRHDLFIAIPVWLPFMLSVDNANDGYVSYEILKFEEVEEEKRKGQKWKFDINRDTLKTHL